MSASWLITDGFSGEASGETKIVTMGLYSGSAPPPVVSDYSANWLSPSIRMAFLVFVGWFFR